MKLYKKLLYTMCMAGSITLTGCDDFLTPDNKSAVMMWNILPLLPVYKL